MNIDQVKSRLESKYPNAKITVTDLTGTEDHYQVYVISKCFEGLTRIQIHRQVMDVFDEELKSGEIHAFTITTATKESSGTA